MIPEDLDKAFKVVKAKYGETVPDPYNFPNYSHVPEHKMNRLYLIYFRYNLRRFVLFLICRGYSKPINWEFYDPAYQSLTPDEADALFKEETPLPLSYKPAYQTWMESFAAPDRFVDEVTEPENENVNPNLHTLI
jgi:hypothetical protein